MLTPITVQSRVDVPTILNLIAAIYPNSLKVLDELVDNGLDAGADTIWVVLEKDGISVIDNGHGMLPDVPGKDATIIDDFIRHTISGEEDIRVLVSPLALKSLRWMVEFAGLSPKALEKGKRGVHGIGAIATRLIANSIAWHTKPNLELARDYWGNDPISSNPPTITLRVPSRDQLARRDISNKIGVAAKPLADPKGRLLESGTHVEMKDLREHFSPTEVVSSLSKRFGNDIRNRGLKLIVINKLVDLVGRNKDGIEIVVEPASYQGIGILFTEGHHRRGEYPFEINLFYQPEGKDLVPQILRQGAPVGPITNIPELRGVYPLNTGKVTGYIAFTAPDNEAPWTAAKDRPQPSARFTQWLESVQRHAKLAAEKIEEIEEKRKAKEQEHRTEIVENALKSAMKELTSFRGLSLFLPAEKKRVKKDRKPGVDRPKEDAKSYISVRDQYRRPVRDVEVQILKNNRFFQALTPGLSGTRSLGKLENGRYTVTLLNETRLYEISPRASFEISPLNNKVHIVITVQVEGSQPDERRISGLRIWAHDLGDPDKPFSIQQLQDGWSTVEINNATYDYSDAIQTNDDDAQMRLKTLYTAMALAEYSFPLESSEYKMSQAAALFNKAYSKALSSIPKSHRRRTSHYPAAGERN